MIDPDAFDARIEALKARLREKLGARGKTLARALRHAGRRLPKWVRREGAVLVDAQARRGHPRIWRQVNEAEIDRAFERIESHLDTIDPKDRRRGVILGLLGGIVFNLLIVLAFLLAVLWWQDLI
ncbi:hypothetical protein K1T73_15135 [Roseovarius sp. SCSIO 43702]|uniref:hypothetical protein n=1 Tax=Roseovarius sp. SCSIO 43702 TaxID=2823043 RepID=UPI001C739A0D|nr:hypothetical protein [Roseovarius sp. SCSIO 43702]QYX56371.1 hypothetical protein K1T73_15135 [Roseovarius sp. SCSIO 43702]